MADPDHILNNTGYGHMLYVLQSENEKSLKKSRVHIGELNSQVEDSLLGVRVVKSFANEQIEEEKFEAGNGKFLEIKKEMYKYMAGFQSTTRMFDGIMYITVVVAGALFMINGAITPRRLDGIPVVRHHPLDVYTQDSGVHRTVPEGNDRNRTVR